MKTKTRLLALFPGLLLLTLLTGCVSSESLKVEVDSAAPIIGARGDDERIPIRVLGLESSDRANEIKSDRRFLSGDSRMILFPKQTRAFISQDLRDYVASRFRIDPDAEVVLILKLEQAYTYFTFHSSGLNWVPVVGLVSSISDGYQQVPVVFVVELKVEATVNGGPSGKINAFVRKEDKIKGWSGTLEAHKIIYRRQISEVRKELFERLDAQLFTLWKDGRFTGTASTPASNAATLASELARLDTALSDEKITKEEHATLTKEVRAKYTSR